MDTKKKHFCAVILGLALAVFVLGSCQKGDLSGKTREGKVILNVLNYVDLTSPNSAGEIQFVWDGFASRNPDIVINREDLFNEAYHNKVEVYAAAGKMPDVLYVWPSGRSTSLHQNKLLKDLTDLISRDALWDAYLPMALDPVNQEGGYVGMIPMAVTSTHAFYINTEVLNDCGLKPAKTYAELVSQVPVLKAKGYETVIMPNKDTWVMQSCLFSMVAGRFCGVGWEENILSGTAKFTGSDFVNALGFIQKLYADGVLSKSSLGTAYGDSPGMFAAKKGAYMIDGDWRVGAFITDKSTGQALITPDRQKNILISVFPSIEGAKLNKSTSGILGTGWAMSSAIPDLSDKEEAAWALIKWLTGKETTTLRIETGGIITPSRTDLDYSGLSLEPIQATAGAFGNEYAITTAVIDGTFHSDIFNPLNDGLAEIGMGNKTPTQVAQDIQQVFDLWKKNQ
jgi:raffinose/stachyose/melibiose transport system substrate-binding protein